jgi:uncharacterized protein YcfJ
MKKLLLLSAAVAICGVSQAQEIGRVLSSIPVVAQVAQPRKVCSTEQVAVQQPKSGAGALLGAIAGGAMGNAVGSGGGKAAATLIGIMGGAIVGDNVEGSPSAQVQNVQKCGVQTFYENRAVAYNVVYEYAGRQYSVQMPHDPGPSVQLQVTPVGLNSQAVTSTSNGTYPQEVIAQAAPIVMSQPTYPVYIQPAYYAPIAVDLSLGYGGGFGGHRRWR